MLPECRLYVVDGCGEHAQVERLLMEWVDNCGLLVERLSVEELGGEVAVLQRLDHGTQLVWPFDADALAHFLK